MSRFKTKTIKGNQVVIDNTSGLMWQQGGSPKYIDYDAAKNYIDDLNKEGFAGFKDWRLPTLDEAMKLVEPKENKNGLYINPLFDATQLLIWTSDLIPGESRLWVVNFGYGGCDWNFLLIDNYVRAVRSG